MRNKPKEICTKLLKRATKNKVITTAPTPLPCCVIWMVRADNTAAAGAQGAEIKRCVPPKVAAIKPNAATPNMPAKAPLAPNSAPKGEKMVTPKAMADGSATNMAAKPPQMSPDKLLGAWRVCVLMGLA